MISSHYLTQHCVLMVLSAWVFIFLSSSHFTSVNTTAVRLEAINTHFKEREASPSSFSFWIFFTGHSVHPSNSVPVCFSICLYFSPSLLMSICHLSICLSLCHLYIICQYLWGCYISINAAMRLTVIYSGLVGSALSIILISDMLHCLGVILSCRLWAFRNPSWLAVSAYSLFSGDQ